MSRFVSIHWDPEVAGLTWRAAITIARVSASLNGWHICIDQPGLTVFCPVQQDDACDIQARDSKLGIVLGTMFVTPSERTPTAAARVEHLSNSTCEAMLRTQGRSVLSSHWGSYIAVWHDPSTASSHVLRSPLSRLKCFYSADGPIHVFFSNVGDYADTGLRPLTVNWDSIRARAACADYVCEQTAINEIAAVAMGECVEIHAGKVSRRHYWHPCKIARDAPITTFDEAVCQLRATAEMCVQSWASRYGRIVHTLSGGLDSAISAACVRKALPRHSVLCVNYYFPGSVSSDERDYARDAAHHIDADLTEIERECSADLDIFSQCAPTAWPMLDFSGYGQYRTEVATARSFGATAIFNGELGDNLFEHGAAGEAAADYVWRHGIRPGLLPVAIDVAMRRNLSIWSVLYRAIVDGLAPASTTRWSSHRYAERSLGLSVFDMTLLRPDALESVRNCSSRFLHPWLDRIGDMPPAKFMMIYGMYVVGSYEPPFARPGDPPVVAPLGGQPLAEVCLRIPSHFCNRGAINRAVARQAFVDQLPQSVLQRMSKGTPEPWTRDVVSRNPEFLRSFLLEGILVKQGILDPQRVESALSQDVGASKVYIADLIVQLYVEAWLRKWADRASVLAAQKSAV